MLRVRLVWVWITLVWIVGILPGSPIWVDGLSPDETYSMVNKVCTAQMQVGKPDAESRPTSTNVSVVHMRYFHMSGIWSRSENETTASSSFLSGTSGRFSVLWTFQVNGYLQNCSTTVLFTDKWNKNASRLVTNGVYNPDSGDLCAVGCIQSNCEWRLTLHINETDTNGGASSEGKLETLRNSEYYTEAKLSGATVSLTSQRRTWRTDVTVKSVLYALEAMCIVWQIYFSIRNKSAYFVSMLMIVVQITVDAFTWVRLLYFPILHMNSRMFAYMMSTLGAIPWLVETILILLNVLFLVVILIKRRIAKRDNVEDRPRELALVCVCIPLYVALGVLLWYLKGFGTYLEVVSFWFLLPQVMANVFWDLRQKPLHLVYTVGMTACQWTNLTYNCLRPRIHGYEFFEFPQSWFWGITCSMVLLLVYESLQQSYGGRCFIPRKWFGYEKLGGSKHDQTVSLEMGVEEYAGDH